MTHHFIDSSFLGQSILLSLRSRPAWPRTFPARRRDATATKMAPPPQSLQKKKPSSSSSSGFAEEADGKDKRVNDKKEDGNIVPWHCNMCMEDLPVPKAGQQRISGLKSPFFFGCLCPPFCVECIRDYLKSKGFGDAHDSQKLECILCLVF